MTRDSRRDAALMLHWFFAGPPLARHQLRCKMHQAVASDADRPLSPF